MPLKKKETWKCFSLICKRFVSKSSFRDEILSTVDLKGLHCRDLRIILIVHWEKHPWELTYSSVEVHRGQAISRTQTSTIPQAIVTGCLGNTFSLIASLFLRLGWVRGSSTMPANSVSDRHLFMDRRVNDTSGSHLWEICISPAYSCLLESSFSGFSDTPI